MTFKRAVYAITFLLISISAGAQINLYLGGNLQANYSWIRGADPTYSPGFGAGFSFVYWEYEYWFIKAGLDYTYKSSSCLHYPDDYDVPITDPDDKVNITFSEQCVGIPLTIYFRPYESGANSLLITGSLEMMFVAHLKENAEEYGELILKGNDIKSRMKSNVGFGLGYQRQLDNHMYLNIVPSFNMDIRAARPCNSIKLTVELLFGVY